MNTRNLSWLVLAAMVLWGCADKRPVLYPNAHLKQVGEEAARRDVDDCMRYAQESGAEGSKGTGNRQETPPAGLPWAGPSAPQRALCWEASVAERRAVRPAERPAVLSKESFDTDDPDPVFKNFVDRWSTREGL